MLPLNNRSALTQQPNASVYECAVPNALDGGLAATAEWDDLLGRAELHGSAVRAGRVVQLTNAQQFRVQGTLITRPPMLSSIPGTSSIVIEFDLLAGRGTGGEGVGVSFVRDEDVQHADEAGVAAGLVVSFDSGSERIRVLFHGNLLEQRRLDGIHPSKCDELNCGNCIGENEGYGLGREACLLAGCVWSDWQRLCHLDDGRIQGGTLQHPHAFRRDAYVKVKIRITDERVSVWHDGFQYIERLHVNGWEALSTGGPWLVAIGARTAMSVDDHFVTNVRMVQGALAGSSRTMLAIGGEEAACLRSYTYYAQPIISRIVMPQGPLAGGTLVRVHGEHFHLGTDGAACRFGDAGTVPATREGTRPHPANDPHRKGPAYTLTQFPEVLACASPVYDHAGRVPLEISLNGVEFTSSSYSSSSGPLPGSEAGSGEEGEDGVVSATAFTYTYTNPHIDRIVPTRTTQHDVNYIGEVEATGPLIRLHGSNLTGGHSYRCDFGIGGTRAAYVDTFGGFVYCAAPRISIFSNATNGVLTQPVTLPVELSLNGVDYTSYGHNLTYYPPPTIESLSPSTGPEVGRTLVSLSGSFARADNWVSAALARTLAICMHPLTHAPFPPLAGLPIRWYASAGYKRRYQRWRPSLHNTYPSPRRLSYDPSNT